MFSLMMTREESKEERNFVAQRKHISSPLQNRLMLMKRKLSVCCGTERTNKRRGQNAKLLRRLVVIEKKSRKGRKFSKGAVKDTTFLAEEEEENFTGLNFDVEYIYGFVMLGGL